MNLSSWHSLARLETRVHATMWYLHNPYLCIVPLKFTSKFGYTQSCSKFSILHEFFSNFSFHLQEMGIPVKADLPVGYGMQSHTGPFEPSFTLPQVMRRIYRPIDGATFLLLSPSHIDAARPRHHLRPPLPPQTQPVARLLQGTHPHVTSAKVD